jgi:predicted small metal-binding protein
MTYAQTCPRCGEDFTGADRDAVADDVVAHARDAHRHSLERRVVLAHLAGVNPNDFDE